MVKRDLDPEQILAKSCFEFLWIIGLLLAFRHKSTAEFTITMCDLSEIVANFHVVTSKIKCRVNTVTWIYNMYIWLHSTHSFHMPYGIGFRDGCACYSQIVTWFLPNSRCLKQDRRRLLARLPRLPFTSYQGLWPILNPLPAWLRKFQNAR